MTYAESRGEKPFDWNEFLNRETITEEEWKQAKGLSGEWVTCACGNQCDIIPRITEDTDFKLGQPKDEQLADLGYDFYEAIRKRNMEEAKTILHDIEQRSAELIAELTKK